MLRCPQRGEHAISLKVATTEPFVSSVVLVSDFFVERRALREFAEASDRTLAAERSVRASPVVVKLPFHDPLSDGWVPRIALGPKFLKIGQLRSFACPGQVRAMYPRQRGLRTPRIARARIRAGTWPTFTAPRMPTAMLDLMDCTNARSIHC